MMTEFMLTLTIDARRKNDVERLADRVAGIIRPLTLGDRDFDRTVVAQRNRGGRILFVATWTTTTEEARAAAYAIGSTFGDSANLTDRIDRYHATITESGRIVGFATGDNRGFRR